MSKSIGVFDSGVGGLTLLEQLIKDLPNESFEYYADSGNCPYGNKSMEEVLESTLVIMDYLMHKDCKLIIVACNTITTNIIYKLRERYPVPIIGLEPGTKLAYNVSKNKRIGILATERTINGQLYLKTLNNFNNKASYISSIGNGLVELIENNMIDSVEMRERLLQLIKPMVEKDIDTLVLGCTHYNYLKSILRDMFSSQIELVDTTKAVVKQVIKVLNENGLISNDTQRKINIVTTGKIDLLNKLIARLDIADPFLNIEKVPAYNINNNQTGAKC